MIHEIEKILPHNHPMILIDKVLEVNLDEKYLKGEFTIKDDMVFYNKKLKGVNSLVGIEFMAQTIAAYSYYRNNQEEPKIGFLLGTRMYNNSIDLFKLNETYQTKVMEMFNGDGIVSFECFIYDKNGEECASATLNVYQSDDAKGLIENGIKE